MQQKLASRLVDNRSKTAQSDRRSPVEYGSHVTRVWEPVGIHSSALVGDTTGRNP